MKSTLALLATVALAGCYDESPSASEPVDPIQVLKQEHVRNIATKLKEAREAFDQRNYDACIALCANVLSREPAYEPAEWLSDTANEAKDATEQFRTLYEALVSWKFELSTGQLIPGEDQLTYPHLGLPTTADPERVMPVAAVPPSKMD